MNAISRRQAGYYLTSLFSGLFTGTHALAADITGPLPHFSAHTMDGEKINNEVIQGKVLLIDFWATWCPPCKSDSPVVDAMVDEFTKDGLIVLSVNMGEARRKVKKYLEEFPKKSKVVLAEDTTLAAICDAKVYPFYTLVDRTGQIVGVQRGAGGERSLRRLLSKAGLES